MQFDALHRADHLALRFVVVADAFGAAIRIDDVIVRAHGNRFVRALWLANVAIDAFFGDLEGHGGSGGGRTGRL
ncbi:hypothetical protein AZ28_0616 [Bordetella pertussis B200]|nr:hypothetical protein AZ28_0616 [Bordetella pertussis B200]